MNTATINVIIGAVLTFIGAGVLFILGAIVSYVRSINKSMRDLLIMASKSETRIDILDRQVEDIYKRINKT